jgi:hypothetical protein
MSTRDSSGGDETQKEVRRRRAGPGWFWAIVGALGLGQPTVDREKMYGDDPRNDPYRADYDPNRRDADRR